MLEGDKATVAQKRMAKAVSMPLRKTAKIEAVLNVDKPIIAVAVWDSDCPLASRKPTYI